MSFHRTVVIAAVVAAAAVGQSSAAPLERKDNRPQVEVVFCLDTTGSMGGLIEGAKQKIWSICNQIASGKPTPDLKVGLVAYRDRKRRLRHQGLRPDDDLDDVHENLKKFKADGGGDTPEAVNQALNEAVNKIKWSKDKKTLRIIFLVGDAPPHMDYADDVKYPETCKMAAAQGIIINTVQCGGRRRGQEGLAGRLRQSRRDLRPDRPGRRRASRRDAVRQGAGRAQRQAGQDERLLRARQGREEAARTRRRLRGVAGAGGVAADSAGFRSKASRIAANDLLDDLKEGKIKLEDVKEDELPDELKKMKPEERKAHVEKLQKERDDLKKKALELDKKRLDFIAKKLAEDKGKAKDGFDNQILETLRKQAEKVNIKY